MQTRSFSYASSDTIASFHEYHYQFYPKRTESCSSRSSSPWSDMTPSVHGDDDVEMTESPASSYTSIEHPLSVSLNSGECDDASADASSGSSSSFSIYKPSTSRRLHPASDAERKAARNAYLAMKERARAIRAARVKELKRKALSINSKDRPNKTPASDHQREVLRLVFDQITPYPDEAWISQLALHFNCRYGKIKNWFSNNRQKDASEYRALHPTDKYDLATTLRQVTCEGRELRMRPSALEHCNEDEWTDSFFNEVVLINDFRLMVKERNEKAHQDAAYVMLEIKNS